MNRRFVLALPGLLLGAALQPGTARAGDNQAAYGADNQATHAADNQAAAGADAQATIDNFTFSPPVLVVSVGAKVTWTNRDDIPHTVTDKDHPREIKSAALDTGDAYSRTFTAPGTYHYFCSLHPHMQGTVVVR